jgi:hypothetical protein
MNLRISNLSHQFEMDIIASDSAHLFNGTALPTTTDSTLTLVPTTVKNASPLIEGKLRLSEDDLDIVFVTNRVTGQVTVSHNEQHYITVPAFANVAIEWNEGVTGLQAY